MAITIKDIHEKEFTKQVRGYSIDEVDDFLDELADQMEAMIKENRETVAELEAAKNAASAVVAQPVQAVVEVAQAAVPAAQQNAPAPLMDEPQYFKNLETTLRETLINAQRLADETVAEARKKANAILANAEEQAATITASAKAEAENARVESDEIRKTADDYRNRFMRLLEEQAHLLKADDVLFK